MKTMKRLLCLSLSAALAFGFAGCGKKEETSDSGEKVKIMLWTGLTADATEEKKQSEKEFMERFYKKYPNIEVIAEVAPAGTDYRQQYDLSLMAGSLPAAYTGFSYTDIPTRIANNSIADITDLYSKWEYKDKMLKNFDEAIKKDGKQYAIVRSAYVMGTTYNRKAIEAGGGDVNNLPETWDEFKVFGKKVTDLSVPRFGYNLVGMDWCAWPFTAWIWSAGGDMVKANGDGTYKICFNEEPGVDTAKFINEMIWETKMTQKDILQDWGKLTDDILSGRACFSWLDISGLSQTKLDKFGLDTKDFGMMLMPVKDKSIPRPAFSGGEVVVFNPDISEKEREAAMKFYSYQLYDEDNLITKWERASQSGVMGLSQIPPRIDMFEKMLEYCTTVSDTTKSELIEAVKVARPEPFTGNWADLKSALVSPLQKIYLKENISREEIRALLNDCAESLYQKFPQSFRK